MIVRCILILEILKCERKEKCVLESVKNIIRSQGSLSEDPTSLGFMGAIEKADLAYLIKVGLKLMIANPV